MAVAAGIGIGEFASLATAADGIDCCTSSPLLLLHTLLLLLLNGRSVPIKGALLALLLLLRLIHHGGLSPRERAGHRCSLLLLLHARIAQESLLSPCMPPKGVAFEEPSVGLKLPGCYGIGFNYRNEAQPKQCIRKCSSKGKRCTR